LDDKFKCGILSGNNIRNLFLYVTWWFACVRVQLFVLKLA